MRIDRPLMHRSCNIDLSEVDLPFIELRLPSPHPAHCPAAIKPSATHGTKCSFRFQESLQSPILHRLFPETPSTLANPTNGLIEHPSPPTHAANPNGNRECWRDDTPEELDRAASRRHASRTLAFATDGQYLPDRNGLSNRESSCRFLLQKDGDTELRNAKDEATTETSVLPDENFMPTCKELSMEEEPNKLLFQLTSSFPPKELEQTHNRTAYGQKLSAHIIGGAFGFMSAGNSSSKVKAEAERFEDHRVRWSTRLHMGGDTIFQTCVTNPFQGHQEDDEEICLDLTLSSRVLSKEIVLPIAPTSVNPPLKRDIGYRALSSHNQNESPKRIKRMWEFLKPVAPDCCTVDHTDFDAKRYESGNPEALEYERRLHVNWASESSQSMLDNSCATFHLGEGARENKWADVNVQPRKHTDEPSSVLLAPFPKAYVLRTDENKISHSVAFKEGDIGELITEDERLARVQPTLPPPFSDFVPEKKQHSSFIINKGKLDEEESILRGSSKGYGERETEISTVLGSCLESEVSYELSGGTESLATTEYCPISACPIPDNIEAQIDGTGWSEDSTCGSKPAHARKELLPSRMFSQTGKLTYGESNPIHTVSTHGALDLLVNAVQVASSPITGACALLNGRQEGTKAGTFVDGGIHIPRKRVNRQARRRARMKKAPNLEPVQGTEQIVGRSGPNALPHSDQCDKDSEVSVSPSSLKDQEFFDPFIESKRGRLRTLPSKFRDSVMEPWKKGIWKMYRGQKL